jgi:hypothetical protein
MGRANSVYALAAVGGASLRALLGGVLAQQFGLVAPFLVAFVGMVATTAVAWLPLQYVTVRHAGAPPA